MPFHDREGVRLYWRLDGASELPPMVLLNSIGVDMTLWDGVLPYLLSSFQVLRLDTRGHGASDAPDGDYSLAMLADDVLGVMDAAGLERAAVAGVSLGGMIAMELALRRPERVAGLALICTSALMDKAAWSDRIARVRSEGMASIVDLAMGRFLSPGFARTHRGVADGLRRRLTGAAPEGYAGCGCAIRDMNLLPRLGALEAPTLVVGGDKDVSTPFADHGARLVEAIPGATAAHVNTGHLAPIEAPDKVAELLVGFFSPQPERTKAMDSLFEAGLANRRRVLGDAWVDQSLAKATPFTADFQAMITRTAWNEIWGRAGLDDRTRRLIVVAITASLGRWEEFALHVQAGLARGGFSQEELKEVLMQTAVYAGVPAANTGFREAGRIIAELDDGD